MPQSNHVMYVRTDKQIVERFDALYPSVRSRFLSRALEFAINSKDFAMQVLFGDLPHVVQE